MADINLRPFESGIGNGFRLVAPVLLAAAAENPLRIFGDLLTPKMILSTAPRYSITDTQPDFGFKMLLTGPAVTITLRHRLLPPFVGLPLEIFGTTTGPSSTEWNDFEGEFWEVMAAPANSYFDFGASVGTATLADLLVFIA